MKKILIIGAANLQHTVNFIDTLLVCDSENQVTVFNTEYKSDLVPEIKSFYSDNAIKVVNTENLSRSKIGKVRAVLNIMKMERVLHRECRLNKQYDMCFILYCSWQSSIWVAKYHNYFKAIIPVYFGSDVLRNRKLTNRFFSKMNSVAEHIILPNLNTLEKFNEKTSNEYADKSCVIQYPQKMVATMLGYQPLHNKEHDRAFFDLPLDKVIVLCGHTATTAEQHEEMIESLSRCRADTLDKCYFVFMMTYAPGDYQEYQERISSIVAKSKLNGTVLKSRIKYEDMPKLHYACDVHITTIKTDAFSCFLQEEMLAGNILIYGKWLNYYEIENDRFFAYPVDTVADLADTVDKVIEQLEHNMEKSKHNIQGIMELASEESIRNEWNRIVFKKQNEN